VDHNGTFKIRGFLCRYCNLAADNAPENRPVAIENENKK